MKKKHAASQVAHMSMCGYEATPGEYAKMQERRFRYVNCKKCLDIMK